MAAVFMNGSSLHPPDDQPMSQASSPSSPGATFMIQQGQTTLPAFSLSGTGYLDGLSQPSTPTSMTASVSLDPPPGIAFADYLRTWNDAHVAAWLTSVKCPHQSTVFRANDIRGDVLLELDQATLKEMGVFTVGDRIRIVAGVKALRQKCSSSSTTLSLVASRPRLQEHNRNGSVGSEGSHSSAASRLGPRRLDNGRPAPLHLPPNSSSDGLPRLVRDGQDSARANPPTRPLPQPNAGSSSVHTPSGRPGLPPIPPPPRGQPPPPPPNARTTSRSLLPPTNQLSGRRTPTVPEAPAFNTSQPLPLPPGQNLPPRPIRSPSPLQNSQLPNRSYSRSPNEHGRNASISGIASPAAKPQSRPSNGPTGHPYSSQHSGGNQSMLSPIAEGFRDSQRHTSSTPSPPTNSGTSRAGTGLFNRPNTPSSNTPSLDDIRRKVIKFAAPGEGKSSMVPVWDCSGGAEILERALKKLKGLEDSHAPHVEIIDGGLTMDGWGVFSDMNTDGPRTPLSESQLLSICQASPDEPVRESGLILRQIKRPRTSPTSPYPASFPKASSSTDTVNESLIPSSDRATPQPGTNAYKRASSISILSGLGVQISEMPESSSAPPSAQESPSKSPNKKGKLRNFFGQRPPSELITTHLAEYFPYTEKKVLERTRRQSMMRGPTNRRDSIMSLNPHAQSRFSVSTQGSRASNRNSVASRISVASSVRERSPPPPMPDTPTSSPHVSISNEEGRSLGETSTENKRISRPHLLPPVALPSESLAESMNLTSSRPGSRLSVASKRMSYIQELRSKRDVSDTASMITVDEITAEVESRREGTGSKDSSDSEEWTAVESSDADTKSIREIPEEDEEDGEDEEFEEEEEEEATEGTLTDDEGEPKAITSRGERTIKWIKGALIGSGSFGKVYLGMDAATGLLMAVKQVELPSQTAPNAERKQSMLNALEREIELLKDLHHENIVQYLSSCVDDDHLNIFLEYVPGGSVTSLLRNYGAFEEPLVRNWVRQILLGLNYLHERDIIHRDIKGANMLVDNKGGIKISDFGISKKVEDNLMPGNRAHRPSLQGSVFWMAPEVVKQTAYTQKADIWSIGCLIVEMLTGEHPFPQLTQMQAIFKIGMSTKPTIPADISPEAESFLQQTFDLDHERRPSAAELLRHPWIANLPAPLGL